MIREATLDDSFDVLMLAHQFGKEAPPCYKFNKVKAEAFFERALTDPTMVWFVSEDDDGICGFIVGHFPDHPFNDASTAIELAWFVTKDKRKGTTAMRLVRAFDDWAKDLGARWISMSDIVGIQDLTQLYTRQGYQLAERSFMKEV